MAVLIVLGAEGNATADHVNNSSEAVMGSGVGIVAGALIGGGGYAYESNMASTKSKGHVQSNLAVPLTSPTYTITGPLRTTAYFQVNNVTTPAFDVPLLRSFDGTHSPAEWEVRYERLTDGNIHLFAFGTEIDSANAFTIPSVGTAAFGSTFGLRVTTDYVGTSIKLESYDGTSWTTHQTGTGSSNFGAPQLYAFEDLGSGVNHNWKGRIDTVVVEDSGHTWDDRLIDVRLLGVPSADTGTYNGWQNSGGTACSVGGANCYAAVDDTPTLNTADYDVLPVSTVAKQSWPTTVLCTVSGDEVLGVGPTYNAEVQSASGGSSYAWQTVMRYGGSESNYNLTTLTAPATSPSWSFANWATNAPWRVSQPNGSAWTVAAAQGCEIGIDVQLNTGISIRLVAMSKVVAFRQGQMGKIVMVNQAVNRAATY